MNVGQDFIDRLQKIKGRTIMAEYKPETIPEVLIEELKLQLHGWFCSRSFSELPASKMFDTVMSELRLALSITHLVVVPDDA